MISIHYRLSSTILLSFLCMTCLGTTSTLADDKTCKPPTYAYAPGTIGFKPISFNFGSISFGYHHKDSAFYNDSGTILNPVKTDAFRKPVDFGFAESDRNGFGYGVELGVTIINDWELFGRFGYCREEGNNRFQIGNYSYDFKDRKNYGFSFGPRKYFDFQSSWKPFVHLAAGFTVQGATNATINWHPATSFSLNDDIPIATYKLTNRKTLFTGELGIGTDYAFTDYFALSFSVAVRFNQRDGGSTTNLPGLDNPLAPIPPTTMTYKDDKQRWVVPFTVALKFMF